MDYMLDLVLSKAVSVSVLTSRYHLPLFGTDTSACLSSMMLCRFFHDIFE